MLARWTRITMALGLVLGAGCVEPDDDGYEDVPDLEGTVGYTRIQTPGGLMTVAYEVRNGHGWYQGDIDLGTVWELKQQRGGAINMGELWTNGVIRYAFADNFTGITCSTAISSDCMDVRDSIRQSLAVIEAMSPIIFDEVAHDSGGNILLYEFDDLGFVGGGSDHVGMAGGCQTIYIDDTLIPGSSNRHILPGVGPDTSTGVPIQASQLIIHETLHVAGMWHEQGRNDRDAYINVDFDCIADDFQYEIREESADLGPYDFSSTMHYWNGAFCESDDGVNCNCDTMTVNVPTAIINPTLLSIEDVATLYAIYQDELENSEAGDHFGQALAAADFDRDGYTDLAIGLPDEDIGSAIDAGAVLLFRGSAYGLQAWQKLTAFDILGQFPQTRDHFGAALVAYDLDRPNPSSSPPDLETPDLAVGVPGRNAGAGAVFVYRGQRRMDMIGHRVLTQANTGFTDENADGFGSSLAAGRITGLLADTLVVGAPMERIPIPGTPGIRSGAVFLYQETLSGSTYLLNKATRIHRATPALGDLFGSSVAVGSLDDDSGGKMDLAVGAPGVGADKGEVTLYAGRLPPESIFLWSSMVTFKVVIPGISRSRFGTSVAIGNLTGWNPGTGEVAIGGPAFSTATLGAVGIVRVMTGGFTPVFMTDLTDVNVEANDRFGTTVAIGQLRLSDLFMRDLLVGVPGENSSAGRMVLFPGTPTGLAPRTTFDPPATGNMAEANDALGTAFAFGNFDRMGMLPSTAHSDTPQQDVAIGVPGEGWDWPLGGEEPAGAGAVTIMRGTATGLVSWQSKHQLSDGM